MSQDLKQYDGFIFTPGDEENTQVVHFLKIHKDCGEIIESSKLGEKYHVAFFKQDDKGEFTLDDQFEATFSDPLTYIKNLMGIPLGGAFIRKREKTREWFDNYLIGLFKDDILER